MNNNRLVIHLGSDVEHTVASALAEIAARYQLDDAAMIGLLLKQLTDLVKWLDVEKPREAA